MRTQWPWFAFAFLTIALFFLQLASSPARFRFARILSPALAAALSLLLVLSGIGCGGGGGNASSSSSQTTPPANSQTAAIPAIQPAGGTFSAAQAVSITDSTAASTIYYTTDGSTPTSASPVYSAPFTLNSATTVQAIASASGYTDSTVTSSTFKFRTGAGTYPIAISVTATPAGSTKSLQLDPISLTLVVN
jgi:Chitobiase/beta-hexosaminidase C-terminal domain